MASVLSTRPRGSLTAAEVVAVTIALLRDEGAEQFTMRRLAAELGVNPMTIYLRFDSKEALLDAVVSELLDDIELPEAEGSLSDRAVALARAVRDHLVGARTVLPIIDVGPYLAESMIVASEVGLELMDDAGLVDDAAVAAYRALFWHAVGFSLAYQSMTDRAAVSMSDSVYDFDPEAIPHLTSLLDNFDPLDVDALFEHATRALFAGLAAANVTHSRSEITP